MSDPVDLSVVIPLKDEEDNILPTLEELQQVSRDWPWRWELIFVDDGSRDQSWEKIREARRRDERVRAVRFRRNFGQTHAMLAGVRHARGPICVMLDGDCQNDPADIPRLMERMDSVSLVIGWRRNRADHWWRKVQSRIANGIRNALTGESVHDIGCAIKAFERDKMLEVPLFEGMHRFLPTLFRYKGWRVTEIGVNHRERTRGRPKYGMWNRVFRSLRDLFAVRWMAGRMIRYELRDEDTID